EVSAALTMARYTSHGWWTSAVLGSWVSSEVPYHTTASRPLEPATAQGMTLVFEGDALSCFGAGHEAQPERAVAYEYQICQALASSECDCPLSPRVTHAT